MKRNFDLIRKLLLEIESKDDGSGRLPELEFADNDYETIEHLLLMQEAGLIDAQDASTLGGRNLLVRRLTWQGHDFLGSVRDNAVWKKTKEGLNKVGSFTFDAVLGLAKAYVKEQLAQHTGISLP